MLAREGYRSNGLATIGIHSPLTLYGDATNFAGWPSMDRPAGALRGRPPPRITQAAC